MIENGTGCSGKKVWEKEKATLHYQECVYDLLKEKADTSKVSKENKKRFQKIGLPQISVEEEVIEHLKHTQKGDFSWSKRRFFLELWSC